MVHVPLALLPTPFPRQAFVQALELATHFNILVDRVSQDSQFLQEALARLISRPYVFFVTVFLVTNICLSTTILTTRLITSTVISQVFSHCSFVSQELSLHDFLMGGKCSGKPMG